MGIGDVGVDLGGGDVGVTKHRLNGADVGAVHKQVGGERMAQGMGADVFGDTGKTSIFFDDAGDGASRDAAEIAGLINGLLIFAVVKKKGGKRISTGVEIISDAVGARFGNEDWAVFTTFAAYHKFAAF